VVAGMIVLKPEVDWTAAGGLFDWALEFLILRLSDKEAVERLHEIVDENLGSLWISEFPTPVRQQIIAQLRTGLVTAAERDLPETDHKAAAVQHLQELVDLTYKVDNGK
jgi:hypothetical protein